MKHDAALVVSIFADYAHIQSNPFSLYAGGGRLKREQAEENVELHETYEKLDEQNKSYHDRGKSGLLERLRKRRDAEPK